MKKLALILWALILPTFSYAQGPTKLCIPNNSSGSNCQTITSTYPLPVTATITPSGIQDVNLTQIGGATAPQGHGVAATALRVELPTDGTGVVGLNAGSQIIGKFGIDQTTPGTTNGVQLTAGTALAGKFGIDQTTPGTTNAVVKIPSSASAAALTKSATQSAASNAVVKSGAGNLYGLTVTIGATTGYVMVFDATSLPANGATGSSMIWCYPVNSNGTLGGIDKDFDPPISFSTGLTLGFSSTACNSITASSTAFFYGRVM